MNRVGLRLAIAGAALGSVVALAAFAPAAWMASALQSASDGRLLLADARGTVWSGSAVPVLTGGPGSRDASALPGRLAWTLGLDGLGAFGLSARHACCINGTLRLRLEPGLGSWKVSLPASDDAIGQWPAGWLVGLGTPFNTLRLGGWLVLHSGGLVAESAAGRWRLNGSAVLELSGASSSLSTLDTLGSYRLTLDGGDVARLTLDSDDGPLLLAGSGEWTTGGLRFRGTARAEPGAEAALDNLLNIIGRRQGAQALLSIG